MKYLVLLLLLSGCAAEVEIRMTENPNCADMSIDYKSARRTAISMSCEGVTVITGQVAIDDETVQALGRNVTELK